MHCALLKVEIIVEDLMLRFLIEDPTLLWNAGTLPRLAGGGSRF